MRHRVRALALMMGFLGCAGTSALAQPQITGVFSAGSYNPGKLASSAFAMLKGQALSDQVYFPVGSWPTTLGVTSVMVCDQQALNCAPVQITYASPSQINVLLPAIAAFQASNPQPLTMTTYAVVGGPGAQVRSNVSTFQVDLYAPDVFFVGYDCAIDSAGFVLGSNCQLTPTSGGSARGAYRGTVTDLDGNLILSGNPAQFGRVYVIWLTGISYTASNAPVSVALYAPLTTAPNPAEFDAKIIYAGPSSYPGLAQIKFLVARGDRHRREFLFDPVALRQLSVGDIDCDRTIRAHI
jgi:uncharacterized protein (TIGR03437 family)